MSNEMTLEALLNSLEETPIEKSASEETPAPSSEEQSSSVKADLEGLLSKEASEENTTSEETTDMNKQAQETGKAIADSILGLLKEAEEGSHAVIQQTEQLVNQQDAATEPTPREGNTVTGTLKDIVARGARDGATHPDQLALNASPKEEEADNPAMPSSDEHSVENTGSDLSKTAGENIEKLAAAQALVDQGYDFEVAVDLVKEAAAEIELEEFEQTKLATVQALVQEGLDLESAVALTKEAMEVLAKEAAEDEEKKEEKKEAKKDDDDEQEKKASIVALVNAGFSAEDALYLLS